MVTLLIVAGVIMAALIAMQGQSVREEALIAELVELGYAVERNRIHIYRDKAGYSVLEFLKEPIGDVTFPTAKQAVSYFLAKVSR